MIKINIGEKAQQCIHPTIVFKVYFAQIYANPIVNCKSLALGNTRPQLFYSLLWTHSEHKDTFRAILQQCIVHFRHGRATQY